MFPALIFLFQIEDSSSFNPCSSNEISLVIFSYAIFVVHLGILFLMYLPLATTVSSPHTSVLAAGANSQYPAIAGAPESK